MPIRRIPAAQGLNQDHDRDGAGVLAARAYGGPAHGRRWIVPVGEMAAVRRFVGCRSSGYTLAFDPRTRFAVRDNFGRYVYLLSDPGPPRAWPQGN